MRSIFTTFALFLALTTLSSAGGVRVHPTPRQAEVDGLGGASVKRMPEGGEFLLSVNKGQNVSFFRIQWFKDGEPIEGATGQDLSFPVADPSMNGTYTVAMANPCATVVSSPIEVIVERRSFQVNTVIAEPTVIAGLHEATATAFELRDVSPNPVSDRATVNFTTREPARISVRIMDLVGNVIATLVNDMLPAGDHSVAIVPANYDMSSSLYYVVLNAPGHTETKPMLLAK